MPSFQISVTPHRRAAGKFVGKARRLIAKAFADRPDVTQSDVARVLGVHRSVISRQLRGTEDISLGRVAEFAWALGYEADLNFRKVSPDLTSNVPITPPGVQISSKGFRTTAGSVAVSGRQLVGADA